VLEEADRFREVVVECGWRLLAVRRPPVSRRCGLSCCAGHEFHDDIGQPPDRSSRRNALASIRSRASASRKPASMISNSSSDRFAIVAVALPFALVHAACTLGVGS
jgi:hypothetical protein